MSNGTPDTQKFKDKTNFQKLIFTHEIPIGSPEPKL